MSNKNYDWIKPGVHAWVAGLVCPVEVEVKSINIEAYYAYCKCGTFEDNLNFYDLYQTESECLEAMKKKL